MIDKIANYIKSKAEVYELYFEDSDSLNIEGDSKKPNFISNGKLKGFAVRVASGKKIGFASTLNINNYKECIDNAIKISRLNNEDKHFKNFAMANRIKIIKNYSNKLINFDANDFFKLNEEIENKVNKLNKNVSITRSFYNKSISNVRIINSNGVDAEEKLAGNSFYYEFKLGNDTVELSDSGVDALTSNKVDESVNRLENLSNKKSINGGEMPVLLHQNTISTFLTNSFESNINAEDVQNGKSILKNKIGQLVADKRISIYDNGIKKGLINTRSFDAEGVNSQNTCIVKNGVLKGFIYDVYTANKENRKSTGNASRSLSSKPRISTNNLMFNKGTKTKEQLIRGIDKGLYIYSILGGHTMNELTGDFSFVVGEGHYIEKGQIKHPLKDVMISGNFYEMLKNIDSIGKEVKHYDGGYYLPLILFNKMNVVGN